MIVYFSTLAVVSFLLVAYSRKRMTETGKRFFYFLVAATLLFVAGFRYRVGTDYVQYARNYAAYQSNDIALLSQPAVTIVARLSALIYDNYATWFFLMSTITILPVMKTISKESCCVWLSVILYILLCCWHVPFNIVKQGAATTVLFAGYPFLRDRKLKEWCIACLLASTFHVTALLMIPVYFLVSSSITRKRTVLIILVGIVILVSYDYLFDLVEILKQGERVLSSSSNLRSDGVNMLRTLVHCVPVLLFFLFRERYDKQDANFACLYNMSLLNAMLNIGSMNSIYLNRFCNYTIIFNVLFIPMLFQPLKRKRSTFWILPLALFFYFVFWSYDLYKGSATVIFHWIFER